MFIIKLESPKEVLLEIVPFSIKELNKNQSNYCSETLNFHCQKLVETVENFPALKIFHLYLEIRYKLVDQYNDV